MVQRSVLYAAVAAMACGSSAAQATKFNFVLPDPRVGTHACIVENAYVIDPVTGQTGGWSNYQKSFIVHVSTCAQVRSPGFSVKLGRLAEASREFATSQLVEKCKNPHDYMLVMTTTIRDHEMGWDTATASMIYKDSGETVRYEGGIFRNGSESSAGTISPTLALRADLSFDLVKGDKATGSDGMRWWTMNGHCTPFDPDQ